MPLLLAAFLGGITVSVLGARVSGPPIFGWLIRGFFGLVVGGIAIWLFGIGFQAIRGAAPASAAHVPEALGVICPACGNGAGDAAWCPRCEFPLKSAVPAWSAEARSWLGNLLILSLGAGLLCLGIFLGVGPFLEGERRIWVGLAYVALALLVASVGVLMLYGGAVVAAEDLLRLSRWSCRLDLRAEGAAFSATASATFVKDDLVHAQGSSTVLLSLAARPVEEALTSTGPRADAFCRAVALLCERGHVALWWERHASWSVGTPSRLTLGSRPAPGAMRSRTERSEQLMMQLVVRTVDRGTQPLVELLSPLLAGGATPVAAAWRLCRETTDFDDLRGGVGDWRDVPEAVVVAVASVIARRDRS